MLTFRPLPELDETPSETINAYVALVNTARRIGGRRAAQHMWESLGLPVLPTPADPGRAIDRFIEACCTRGVNLRVRAEALREAYNRWAIEEDGPQFGPKGFGAEMTSAGFERRHSNGAVYLGIALRPEAE